MKPTTYINWDGLKDIPFFYCDTKEDEENKDFDIYYQGRLVLHDYNHCGHYLYTAAVLFSRIKNKTADWVNLRNLWILRDCVRENYNHGIGHIGVGFINVNNDTKDRTFQIAVVVEKRNRKVGFSTFKRYTHITLPTLKNPLDCKSLQPCRLRHDGSRVA